MRVALSRIEQVHAKSRLVRAEVEVINALLRRVAKHQFLRVRVEGKRALAAVRKHHFRRLGWLVERLTKRLARLDQKLAGLNRRRVQPIDRVGDEDGK